MTEPSLLGRTLLWMTALLVPAAPGVGHAAEASSWVKSAQSEARLIEGRASAAGRNLPIAGLEIRLAPHFITYWRNPGDAGVPPSFGFAGSTNLKSARVRYPAPHKLDEAGAVAFGYEDDVVFPILIEAVDPSKPVGLTVAIDYAACHEICLPAHADLHLALDGDPSADADRVGGALASVPRAGTVGGEGRPVAIESVTPDGDGGFTVTATVASDPQRGGATLFVEAPEGWAYEAGTEVPADDAASGAGRAMFPVKRLDHPPGVEHLPDRLTLTLTVPMMGAVEVPVDLDVPPSTR